MNTHVLQGRWEIVENGYHKHSRYVIYPSGLIVGHVEGTPYDSAEPWYAAVDGTEGRKNIGTYTTEGLAKQAVEAAQPSAEKAGTE